MGVKTPKVKHHIVDSLFWEKYPYCLYIRVKFYSHKVKEQEEFLSKIRHKKVTRGLYDHSLYFTNRQDYQEALEGYDRWITDRFEPPSDAVEKYLLDNPSAIVRDKLFNDRYRYKMTFQKRAWKLVREQLREWLSSNSLVENRDFQIAEQSHYLLLAEEEDFFCFKMMFGRSLIKQQTITLINEIGDQP